MTRRVSGTIVSLMACLALALSCAPVHAAWPEKTIRIIVTNAPGGPTDEVARLLAHELAPLLGGTFVVENRPGAASNIGITAVARAEPDGYTLLLAPNSITVNPALQEKLAYDPVVDFAPISLCITSPVVFVVSAKLGVNSIADLVTLSKQKPGGINYSSPGVGTVPHLAAELLKLRAGVNMVHVPHNGASLAVQSVLTGAVELSSGALAPSVPLIEGGQLKGLAVSTAKRWRGLPDVPTMIEVGYTDFVADSFFALFAPAKTPADIVKRLADASATVLKRPEVAQRLYAGGMEAVAGSPEELRERVAREIPFWRDLAAKIGMKPRQ